MSLKQLFDISSKGLLVNRSRSALTILGIVIGIAAIIMVMSIGKGAEGLILKQVQGMGSKNIAIEPGRQGEGMDFSSIFTDSLRDKELETLLDKENVPHGTLATPIVMQTLNVSYEGEGKRTTVIGASGDLLKMFDVDLDDGVDITEDDIRSNSAVAIIGYDVKQDVFGFSNAVGEKIKIKDKTFRVVGAIGKKGQIGFLNVDKMVLIPHTTARQYLMGIDYFNQIILQTDSEANLQRTVDDVTVTLRDLHDITDITKDDFTVHTQEDAAQMVGNIMGILTAFLVAVAAISLLVGGVGIMNIMLVSVTERTKEIGLRKALGATDKDIMSQFLLEAVMLTASGGLFGIILGAALSFLISIILSRFMALNWSFVFPVSAAVIGIVVSGFIGIVFGLFPAKKASEKSPIEALRSE
ncbi:MAG: ABC transporter permease [Candidatus Colwellbacteria bacterium]|nr:ABC transporter permease [Candidatus Colwellbacteria bacterium]